MVREIEINGIEVSYMVDYEADTCAYWFGVPGTHDTRTDMFTCLDGRDVEALIKVFVRDYIEKDREMVRTIKFNGIGASYIIQSDDDIVVYWCFNPNFDEHSDEEIMVTGSFFGACDSTDEIEDLVRQSINYQLGVKEHVLIKFSSSAMAEEAMVYMPSGGCIQVDNCRFLVLEELLKELDKVNFNYQKLPL